jgi:hypothetical protein
MAWQPDYVTSAELKSYTDIDDTDDDVQITIAVATASRAIDEHCNRQFGVVAAAEERVYTAQARTDRGRWVIAVDDFMSVTSLAVEVDGDALTAYTKEPRNAAAEGRPWTRLVVDEDSAVLPTGTEYEIAVTALWGWSAVPTPVKQAALLQAQRFLVRRKSPFGVAGSPELGNELRLLARLDPDVAVSLRSYVRPRRVG